MKNSSVFMAMALIAAGSGAMVAKSSSLKVLRDYIRGLVFNSLSYSSTDMTMVINEFSRGIPNKIFQDAKVYLSTRISLPTANRDKFFRHVNGTKTFSLDKDEEAFVDTFLGVKISWILRSCKIDDSSNRGGSYYNLTFPREADNMVFGFYLPFVSREAASKIKMLLSTKTLEAFSLDESTEKWRSLPFNHPSTFETLAMDPQVKKTIMDDLDLFLECPNHNHEGKAWNRGYLLYGTLGTGKTSLVAAMSNYLKANIYDLDLNQVSNYSQLRMLLMATANGSILLVEDINYLKNRSAELEDDGSKVTLSGLIDFMDRGWSNSGDKRIIIFTTNNKEMLDPALGRMDVHIHLPNCTPIAFDILVSNYLNISAHRLFTQIKELLLETEVSPAEVAGQLSGNKSVDKTLEGLVEFLTAKKVQREEDS